MRVFISSTAADFAQHRQVAERAVLKMGWTPVLLMEHEAVVGGPTVRSCQELVWTCDFFVLIVGFRCGWIPSAAQGGSGVDSITAIELGAWNGKMRARGGWPPLIMFATGGEAQIGQGETPIAAAAQTIFRERLRGTHIVHAFTAVPQGHPDAERCLEGFRTSLLTQFSAVRTAIAAHQQRVAEERTRQAEATLANERANDWIKVAVGVGLGWLFFGDTGDDEEGRPPRRR